MEHYHFDQGKTFPPSMVFAGYVIMGLGLLSSLVNPFIGPLFALGGAFVALAKTGIAVDAENELFRSYNNFLGFHLGHWQSLKEYKFICILKVKRSTKAISRAMVETETSSSSTFDINLLNGNHRKKMLIASCSSKEKAQEEAMLLSRAINMDIVPYQPQLSAKTLQRRRR